MKNGAFISGAPFFLSETLCKRQEYDKFQGGVKLVVVISDDCRKHLI